MGDFLIQPEPKSVIILGASFTTGNLGVSALAWSSIKALRANFPNVSISLISGRQPGVETTRVSNGQQEDFPTWPVRYCANLFVKNHIIWAGIAVFFCRFIPLLRKNLTSSRSTLGQLLRCDLICDITGGDSFSDIYGIARFFRGYLLKRVCQLTGKPYILLPQTYGPFKSLMARMLARKVLKCTGMIYSRDQDGIAEVRKLIGSMNKVRTCPDVAFILDPIRPINNQSTYLDNIKKEGQRLIGLNISGLLYNGGYTRDNMFDLACDYPTLVSNIALHFSRQEGYRVLLVPHVLPSSDLAVEDDYFASVAVLKDLSPEVRETILLLERGYDQNETKYFIGLCDFFLGARMHATIAALSQGVPAVGMAYSRKFTGVFETVGVENCVLDLRRLNNEQILYHILEIYSRRNELRAILEQGIPEIKGRVINMFKET